MRIERPLSRQFRIGALRIKGRSRWRKAARCRKCSRGSARSSGNGTLARLASGRRRFLVQVDARLREMPVLLDVGWPAQQIALGFVARFSCEKLPLSLGLYAFRKNRQAEAPAETKHGAHDRGRLFVAVDRTDERAIDLDLVERKC